MWACDCAGVQFLHCVLYLLLHHTMPLWTISHNLKARIPALFFEQDFTVNQICVLLGVKKTLIYKTLQYFHVYSIAHNPNAHKTSYPQTLSSLDIRFIAALMNWRHYIYLNEICHALSEQHGCEVSISTISHTLKCLNFSWKSVSVRALECNDLLQAAYMNKIVDLVTNLDMLIFIDEAACNRHTSGRSKGWVLHHGRDVRLTWERGCVLKWIRYDKCLCTRLSYL